MSDALNMAAPSNPDDISDIDEDEEALADDEYDMEALELLVQHGEASNIRHEAIDAPESACPFTPVQLQVFETALSNAESHGIAPEGYRLHTHERNGDAYPASETIQVAGKDVDIQLNLETWLPRATRWVCALALMEQLLEQEDP